LVTHDRLMLERVSTVILALDGEGGAETFADHAQWQEARDSRRSVPSRMANDGAPARERPRAKRLSYLEQREWDGMEDAVLEAEAGVEGCRVGEEAEAVRSGA